MQHESAVRTVEASEAGALEAAREFAAVLAETPEYEAFDQAQSRLRHDAVAQEAIQAFQRQRQSLQTEIMLSALSDADRNHLQRLQGKMLAQPSVRAYVEAQERLSLLCQEVAEIVSEVIGLSFATRCGPGCC